MHKRNTWWAVHLIFIGLIVIQSLSVGIIMLKQHGLREEILLAHARDMMRRLADGAIQHTSRHLQSAEDTVRITTGLVKSGFLVPKDSEALEFYFLEVLKNSNAISGIVYGSKQGEFTYVTRQPSIEESDYLTKTIDLRNNQKLIEEIRRNVDFSIQSRDRIENDYDPRTRPWYSAFLQQKLLWTDPYIFFTSENPGITVSKPSINQSDVLNGAFGVDIEISNLSDFLAHRQISSNSFSFVVSHNGLMAAHSNIESIKRTDKMGRSRLINIVDLTENKIVNDTHGHSVGDELLVAIAGRLQGALSDNDIIGRYGGEEFIVLLTNTTSEQGMRLCERLRLIVADTPVQSAAGLIKVTLSIGLAPVLDKNPDIEQALNLADQAHCFRQKTQVKIRLSLPGGQNPVQHRE